MLCWRLRERDGEQRERASVQVSPGRKAGPRERDHSIVPGKFGLSCFYSTTSFCYLSIICMNSMGFCPNCMRVCECRIMVCMLPFALIVRTIGLTVVRSAYFQHALLIEIKNSLLGEVSGLYNRVSEVGLPHIHLSVFLKVDIKIWAFCSC
jgi:hypothetical protein